AYEDLAGIGELEIDQRDDPSVPSMAAWPSGPTATAASPSSYSDRCVTASSAISTLTANTSIPSLHRNDAVVDDKSRSEHDHPAVRSTARAPCPSSTAASSTPTAGRVVTGPPR